MIGGDFLGRGWRFPVNLEREDEIMSEGEENIRDSIWIILATAPGERVMRPEFGCGIHRFLFAVNDASARGRIANEVREALIRWEPRIEVVDTSVELNKGRHEEVLLIIIRYRVRSTNNFFNLVYPFYLAGLR